LQDALVQDYDGLLTVAPAWPGNWDVDGTVHIQHRGKVDVQIRNGAPVTVAPIGGTPATTYRQLGAAAVGIPFER
jgi:hypothetical protein